MSHLTAINQELLRQINDSVGYKIKTKVDTLLTQKGVDSSNIIAIRTTQLADSSNISTLLSQNGADSSNIIAIRTTQLDDSSNISFITDQTVNLLTDSSNISLIAYLSLASVNTVQELTDRTVNLLTDSSNISFITAQTVNLLTDSANISFISSYFPKVSNDANVAASGLQSISSNVNYLSEVTAINDTSLASTESKSLAFHKFLTTEHIPSSNIYAPLNELEKTNDTYATGLGAIGVRKNGVNVFEEYYNGNYPGSMFGSFSCGKEIMGLIFGRMMEKNVALHNLGTTDYSSNVLSLDTTVETIIYGTDIKKYGATGITLPPGLEKARMRDLLSMRAGFHEYDGILWFIYWEFITLGANGGGTTLSAPYSSLTPFSWQYKTWAAGYSVTITDFNSVKNLGNTTVNLRNFAHYVQKSVTDDTATQAIKDINVFLTYSAFIHLTTDNVMGNLFIGNGYSNTSVAYQRTGYQEFYGIDKFEHYNNESFTFATAMMQIALFKELKYGTTYNVISAPQYLDHSKYSSVSALGLTTLASNTFAGNALSSYVSATRDNFRTFFKREILVPSGVPSINTKLTELQSDNYGTILCDNTRVAFPHFMAINDTFAKDVFLVLNNPSAKANVYSNLYLSNITLYNFTASSSNIIPALTPANSDPFDTVAVSGEKLNVKIGASLTQGMWTYTDIQASNKQVSSNIYGMWGTQGQKSYLHKKADGSIYTVGMLSDDYVNNPLFCQGPEFLQNNKNTLTTVFADAVAHGKTDSTSLLLGYWFPDNLSVPIFAYGAGAIFGVRTRQEADKVISYIQDIKVSSNNWGYDSVGGTTLRINPARAYYSNLTSPLIQTANVYTGVASGTSITLADVHYSQYDIFEKATLTF